MGMMELYLVFGLNLIADSMLGLYLMVSSFYS